MFKAIDILILGKEIFFLKFLNINESADHNGHGRHCT